VRERIKAEKGDCPGRFFQILIEKITHVTNKYLCPVKGEKNEEVGKKKGEILCIH
jgi:hypothetical protein